MYFLEGLGFNFYRQGKNVLFFFLLLLRFLNGHPHLSKVQYCSCVAIECSGFSCLGSTLLKSWSPSNSGHHLSLWLTLCLNLMYIDLHSSTLLAFLSWPSFPPVVVSRDFHLGRSYSPQET